MQALRGQTALRGQGNYASTIAHGSGGFGDAPAPSRRAGSMADMTRGGSFRAGVDGRQQEVASDFGHPHNAYADYGGDDGEIDDLPPMRNTGMRGRQSSDASQTSNFSDVSYDPGMDDAAASRMRKHMSVASMMWQDEGLDSEI